MAWMAMPDTLSVDLKAFDTLMDAVGSPTMDTVLFECANRLMAVDEIFGFDLPARSAPLPLSWMGSRADATARVEAYTHHFHGGDPLIGELKRNWHRPSMLVRRVLASAIPDIEYRWQCYDKPSFAEKIAIARPTTEGWNVMCFYRRSITASDELRRLVDFAAIAVPAVRSHVKALRQRGVPSAAAPMAPPMPVDRLLPRLTRRFPGLTERERSVCAWTLLGATAQSIGIELGIATTTVLTYRRRAYQRLGIANAHELVPQLLE
ncbi:MAG TPA: helix-turn-helix transcriptional regulator [Stellaceae bacterium]|nr:helix-turn-helix transcriptional regulator [Stellaceae bacterium]